MPDAPRLLRMADLLDEGFADAKRRHEAFKTGRALGPVLPLAPKLSAAIGGHFPVGLTVLHGPPGSAKTALANQLGAEAGCPALVITCEMDPIELLRRHAARVTRTYVSKFRTGQLAPSEWLHLMRRTVATMPDLAILDGTCAPVSLVTIREKAEATRGGADHLLIVLDSMQAWLRGSGSLGGASEYDATNAGLESLRRIAQESACAMLVIAEQNRASMGSDRQDAAAGSRVFEYCAEVVVSLYRDPNVEADIDGEIPIRATLPKNRQGAPGVPIDLRFNGGFMAFREGDGAALVSPLTRKRSA